MQIISVSALKKSGYPAAFFSSGYRFHKLPSVLLALLLVLLPVLLLVFLQFMLVLTPAQAQERPQAIEVDAYLQLAAQKKLADHPVWSALLHVNEGKANIRSPSFLLSAADFSLTKELDATLRLLYTGDAKQVCRFPARYLWLRTELNLPELALQACDHFQEFKVRAPAEEITLAFASENLAQPSSMMGHTFLKLSGTDAQGRRLEHAISFFTDAGGINLPKLFFDSMVIGKTGYFSLSPYQEKMALYLGEEQRSIWEYALRLSHFQKDLIQAHLEELRQTELVYFFQKYNCATVIDFILSIAGSGTLKNNGFWLTPKDVVKRAKELDLIENSRLISPNRWLIRALGEQFDANERSSIQQQVQAHAMSLDTELKSDKTYMALQLARAYQAYRNETKKDDPAQGVAFEKSLTQIVRDKYPQHQLQVFEIKNPLETPQDSQLALGIVRQANQSYARIHLTPASHHIDDDNRQYFSETELLLFDLTLLKNLQNQQLLIDQFTVYAAKSLIPYDAMSGGVSGAIRIGMEAQFDAQFTARKTAYMEGALGFTTRAGQDIDSFALLGMGLGWRNGRTQWYVQPEVGLIAREIFDMKSRFSVLLKSNLTGDQARYVQYRFVQSKYFKDKDFSVQFSVDTYKMDRRQQHSYELSLKKMF
jgi:hypothetical protein